MSDQTIGIIIGAAILGGVIGGLVQGWAWYWLDQKSLKSIMKLLRRLSLSYFPTATVYSGRNSSDVPTPSE